MENGKLKQSIIRIVKGSIIAILVTLVLLFIFSIILTYTNLQEKTIAPIIIIISAISIFIGSSISTIHIKKNGLINGMIVGLIYITTTYIISSTIGTGFYLNSSSLIMIIISVVSGMIGGIIGINIFN